MHCIFAVRFSRGSLAQLVQSAALTGQRSLVRIQYGSRTRSRALEGVRLLSWLQAEACFHHVPIQ